jgi:hypothetical protein
MKIKSEQEEAIGKIERLRYQLPNKFKIIGLVLCIISIFSISIIAFSLENFKYNDVLDRIAKTVLVLGFIISISKENRR